MIKLLPDTSFIFVFDSTDLPDQIAETAVSAIWADRAVGSKTKCLRRASGSGQTVQFAPSVNIFKP